MSYLIGIDVGTTGAKVLLINEEGVVVSKAFKEYPLHIPQQGWAEQDPEDWWDATAICIKKVLEDSGLRASDIMLMMAQGTIP